MGWLLAMLISIVLLLLTQECSCIGHWPRMLITTETGGKPQVLKTGETQSTTKHHKHVPSKNISEAPSQAPTSSNVAASAPSPSSSSSYVHHHGKTSSSSNGTLEPAQMRALRDLGVMVTSDPCKITSANPVIECDEATPYRHIVSLQLDYCPEDLELPSSSWTPLSYTLSSLSFKECPARPFTPVPKALSNKLTSLTISASLGRSVFNVLAPPLPSTWLASFPGLVQLSISDVLLNGSLELMLPHLPHLHHMSISNTNLSCHLPHAWYQPLKTITLPNNELTGSIPPSLGTLLDLQSLDLSSNYFNGFVPEDLASLQNLQYLSLASNDLNGPIPDFIQNLTSLIYLDLSDNQFNGTIPTFFMDLPNLRYVNLQHNNLEGEVPFNDDFLKRLNSFKLVDNPSLCYNRTTTSSKYVQGVDACVGPRGKGASYPSPSASPEPDPFKDVPLQRGPNKVVIVIALGLACTMGAILTATLLSRRCSSKDQYY